MMHHDAYKGGSKGGWIHASGAACCLYYIHAQHLLIVSLLARLHEHFKFTAKHMPAMQSAVSMQLIMSR
jgi:hypothetical protein